MLPFNLNTCIFLCQDDILQGGLLFGCLHVFLIILCIFYFIDDCFVILITFFFTFYFLTFFIFILYYILCFISHHIYSKYI